MNTQHFKAAVAFGRELITTGDLDPVYLALAGAQMDEDQLSRTLLAYFCLYHLGVAAYIGEWKGAAYWDTLESAARNANRSWPRGTERRHWRGEASIVAVRWLRDRYADKPDGVVFSWFHGAKSSRFTDVAVRVQEAPSFGPWIAFKVADMMERVLRLPVDFSDCALGVYREPRAGAALVLTGDTEQKITDGELNGVINKFLFRYCKLKAPPYNDRFVNVQEIETVLCKYKSHCNGHYPMGKDTREVHHALTPCWGKTALRMRKILGDYL